MAPQSFEDFTNLLYVPQIVIFSVFLGTKFFIYAFLLLTYSIETVCLCKYKLTQKQPEKDIELGESKEDDDLHAIEQIDVRLRATTRKFLCASVYRVLLKIAERLILLIFGGNPDDFVSSSHKLQREKAHKEVLGVSEEKDSLGVTILYFRSYKLSHRNIIVGGLLMFSCCTVAALAAWNAYFMRVTHNCDDSTPATFCFPRFVELDNPLDLMINDETRITNCSEWMDEEILGLVAFTCFHYELNVAAALGIIGGLTVIIPFVLQKASLVLLWIFSKCIHCPTLVIWSIRLTCVFVFGLLLDAVAIYLTVALVVRGNNRDDDSMDVFHTHAATLVLTMSALSVAFIVPWDEIARAEEKKMEVKEQ